MKSGTAAYWLPITVDSIADKPDRYIGYIGKSHPGIDEWLTEGLDLFTDIYGSVVDAHYVTNEVSFYQGQHYDFITEIVVVGIVDSEGEFEEVINGQWPSDLIEQLNQAASVVEFDEVIGYDLNTIRPDPVWSKFNR